MKSTTSQHAPVCRQCGYNLTGLDAVASCPECGEVAPMDAVSQQYRPWLHRYAMLFVTMTFGLLMLGGTVTSKGVGLAVPDWPTTFDYNMFLFPPSQWVGGIFWEHTHRLMGSLVGMMAIAMAIWLWVSQRPQVGGQKWLRWFGVATLIMVIIQGVMGGLRVTELSIAFAVFHGITAQLFFCMTILIAAATSRWWLERANTNADISTDTKAHEQLLGRSQPARRLKLAYVVLGIVLIQLVLGATMRHNGAGLAIPDFPTNYGSILPPLNQVDIETAMIAHTGGDYSQAPHTFYTVGHVAIHFAHRVWAIVVFAALVILAIKLFRSEGQPRKVLRSMSVVLIALATQIALGAWVILSTRHPEIATAHQAVGALLLGNLFLLVIRMRRLPLTIPTEQDVKAAKTKKQSALGLEAAQA